jgi:hypothetical protein
VGELEDFLTSMMSRQIEAEEIIHNGDAAPRLELWTRNDPVTLFGAIMPFRRCCSAGADRAGRGRQGPAARAVCRAMAKVGAPQLVD